MLRSSKALTDFVKISEVYRKGFSEQLRKCLSVNDDLKNQIFELDQNKKLTYISYEII
jgi:predicted RNA-binding protein with RPS1 domain